MNYRTKAWSIAVCLFAFAVVVIVLKTRPTAAQQGFQTSQRVHLNNSVSDGQPPAHVSNASLRAVVSSPMLMDDEEGLAQRVSATAQRNANLPTVEEFTLTPPNPSAKVYKTRLAVRFPELAAGGLASAVPTTLGDQQVVLRRSPDDPRVFSANIDFDWDAFAKEQQRRKDAADAGRMVPVFEGRHFIRMEKMQFVDPDAIHGALQSHEPIQFDRHVLEGDIFGVVPGQELMIVDPSVVEDSGRTWDICTGGTQTGAWTFGTLMTAIAGGHSAADVMVTNWLKEWDSTQHIAENGLTVAPRNLGPVTMDSLLLNGWQKEQGTQNVDVNFSPMRLDAIVNRIDLGQGTSETAGELRFVFGVLDRTKCNAQGGPVVLFNVIVEYNVPLSGCLPVFRWAQNWQTLGNDPFPSAQFNRDLETLITGPVVTNNAASNLNQVRTNEAVFENPRDPNTLWELRAFALSSGALSEVNILQTPEGNPDTGLDYNQHTCPSGPPPTCLANSLSQWVNNNQPQINFPGTYSLPAFLGPPQEPFLGSSAFNPVTTTWWLGGSNPPIANNTLRREISANTCNGCHGRETIVGFQQVVGRQATGNPSQDSPSALAGFLVGCSNGSQQQPLSGGCVPLPLSQSNVEWVADPVDGSANSFGDIQRRAQVLQTILGNACTSGGILQGFSRHPINFVH